MILHLISIWKARLVMHSGQTVVACRGSQPHKIWKMSNFVSWKSLLPTQPQWKYPGTATGYTGYAESIYSFLPFIIGIGRSTITSDVNKDFNLDFNLYCRASYAESIYCQTQGMRGQLHALLNHSAQFCHMIVDHQEAFCYLIKFTYAKLVNRILHIWNLQIKYIIISVWEHYFLTLND